MISVAATKKKRGRPRAFGWLDNEPEAKICAAILTTGASRRVALHWLYAAEAWAALRAEAREPDPRYAWFDGPKPRLGVLTEFGRIAVELGHDNARKLADMLAQDLANGLTTTTREVERWLRH